MQPAGHGRIADRFTHSHGEGDDVVLHTRFKFMDARDIYLGPRADRCGRFFWHLARFRESFGSGDFYLKPPGEAVRVTPDMAHLRARVAW